MKIKEIPLQETGNATQEMIADLQAAFYEMLKENEWMDEETKAYAEVKAKGMGNLVGHSEFILDDGKLDEYYQEVSRVGTNKREDAIRPHFSQGRGFF